jgi:hypothetical protein
MILPDQLVRPSRLLTFKGSVDGMEQRRVGGIDVVFFALDARIQRFCRVALLVDETINLPLISNLPRRWGAERQTSPLVLSFVCEIERTNSTYSYHNK